MLHLAATATKGAASAADTLKQLPPQTWLKIGIGVTALIVTVIVLRKVLKMNKVIMGVLVFVVGTVLFFSWVYNRNEPAFLTPIIEKVAPFFPSAGSYSDKQQTAPKP
jgi:MFS superfamily sulfate permease-like transporter